MKKAEMGIVSICVAVCVFSSVNLSAITVSPTSLTFDCNSIQTQSEVLDMNIQSVSPVTVSLRHDVPTKPFKFARPLSKITDPDIITERLNQSGLVDVIVTLDYALTDSMPATAAAKIQYLQEQLSNKPAMNNAAMKHVYENVPAMAMAVDQQMLDFLLTSDLVAGVEPVMSLEAHTAQGLPLMGADVYRSTYDGSGISIAILDSGIDYTHPALGGGGFPNAKVIGGYDYGNNDADPMPSGIGHGTSVAGIAAGDITNYQFAPNYIGGVAPGAKLYALKVMPDGSGSTDSSKLLSAVDWCVSHQYDDPDNPILAINMSVGGGRYYSSCDSISSALLNAFNAAAAAGITVLASSGNEGYCDSISQPACFSNVISVGAVFDATLGTLGICLDSGTCLSGTTTTSCPSPSVYYTGATSADMVASYSNSASFLDVLAPSHNASTLDIVGSSGSSTSDYYNYFGGTSAACPYAAGAVAALQSAAVDIIGRFLTPDEVRSVLTQNGDPVVDFKNSITKPRINLANSIEFTDIYNGQQISVYNPNSSTIITSITTPEWLNVYPQPPVSVGRRETVYLYAQGDCEYCNYENLSGSVVISGSSFSESVSVSTMCPACQLIANLTAGCSVDIADLTILASCWLSSDTGCQNADINSSGTVSLEDYAILADEWLQGI